MITGELRKWVRDGKGSLLAIADRIDSQHERACKESYASGAEHGIGIIDPDRSCIPLLNFFDVLLDGYAEEIEQSLPEQDLVTVRIKTEGNAHGPKFLDCA